MLGHVLEATTLLVSISVDPGEGFLQDPTICPLVLMLLLFSK